MLFIPQAVCWVCLRGFNCAVADGDQRNEDCYKETIDEVKHF